MDVGSLLSSTKWQLVELIAQSPKSPNELAKQLKTSIANVSIQLRTLELASIVSRTRISRPTAGSPRILYSLRKDLFFFTGASKLIQARKSLQVNAQKEFVLAVWQLPENMHQPLLTLYFTEQQIFSQDSIIAITPTNSSDMSIQLLFKGLKTAPKPITLEISSKKVVFSFTQTAQIPDQAVVLHSGDDVK